MKSRKYTKKSTYWNDISKKNQNEQSASSSIPNIRYEFDDSDHFTSVAACNTGGGSITRDFTGKTSFKNINSGGLPWETKNGHVSITEAALLCQRAYANVAIIRNTIESAVEFSASPLHVITSNKTVKDFFYEWFNKINITHLVDNFMREYYRSGNVFLYKFIGRMNKDNYGQMKSLFGSTSDLVPIRYIVLNPAQVYLDGGLGQNGQWIKMLSKFEIERLLNPKTNEDKQVLNSLPLEVRKGLKRGSSGEELFVPLDTSRLYYVFYKKQDYEPMAIPMVFPVLNDIEWKLELKKMDMALSRTIEQVILLITTGAKKEDGGVNPENIRNLQSIFKNQTLGRVLVADYTTKGEWLIPDIGSILGQEKYKQVDADIKEGLQSILVGEDKFANAQIKAKVFIERMKEGQKAFLTNFLLPEIKSICETMNFKNVPTIKFEEISLSDPAVMSRIYTQLLQLGSITPEEAFLAIQSGILPDKESNLNNQKEYKQLKDEGYYAPLVGGSQTDKGGRPEGTKAPQSTKNVAPIGTKASTEEKYSSKKLAELVVKADSYKELVKTELKSLYNVKGDLNEAQSYTLDILFKNILANEDYSNWTKETAIAYCQNPKEISPEIGAEIDELSIKYELDQTQAALIRKCKI
jgi:hypothetical protein